MNPVAKVLMSKYLFLLPITLTFGCAQMFPARSVETSPGHYQVETSGNMFASTESMIDKVDQKAASLCGKAGFEYINDEKLDTHLSAAYYKSIDISMPYNVLRREIVCK